MLNPSVLIVNASPYNANASGCIVNASPYNGNASGCIVNASPYNGNASAALLMHPLTMAMHRDALKMLRFYTKLY
ncbi:hypothetical protein [uncultured Nostoc sp.]|uniref:hypothetical protein n=1 Tax=uncultured Nostoc sp. TaxID=340711 RepID=UPI0035CC7E5F